MKSPHPYGWDTYQEPFSNRELPAEEEQLVRDGYKFLDWQITRGIPEYDKCLEQGHNHTDREGSWKTKQHTNSGSDVTYWCPTDKIYWKIDMSD